MILGKIFSALRPHLLTLFGVLLAVTLLYFAVQGADWAELGALLRQARLEDLTMAAGIMLVSFLLRGRRWQVLLSAGGRIGYSTVFWANMSGYLANNYLPARAGEVLRTMLLARATGWSRGFIFGTVLVERGLDAVTLVALGGIAVAVEEFVPVAMARSASVLGLLAVVALLGLLAVEWVHRVVEGIVRRLPLAPEREAWVLDLGRLFFEGVKAFRSPVRAWGFLVITLMVWFLDSSAMFLIARSVGLTLSFSGSLLLVTALGLSSAAPSTPGFVGVYQFVAVTVLTPFGFSRSQALATVLAYQFVVYVIITVVGLIGLWRMRRGRRPGGS
ncbi:MAG: lysylphosphatidylglycerol synthase transmembrane domain-containing protein [Alphaproteobacteria bacterium]